MIYHVGKSTCQIVKIKNVKESAKESGVCTIFTLCLVGTMKSIKDREFGIGRECEGKKGEWHSLWLFCWGDRELKG